jgi:succinyl-CoA synthetase alpha subunit
MAILINHNSSIVLQGACTRKGQLLLSDMLDYNSNVCAGVCYLNKNIKEVRGVTLYKHLAEALNDFSSINISIIASGSYDVLNHAIEAMEAGIKTVVIYSDSIPLKDVMLIRQEAVKHNATLIGPNSAGIINPDICMLGSMGGIHALSIFKHGNIGLISRSNGLIYELSIALKNNNIGISTAISIGTEKIPFSDYIDIYEHFVNDDETKLIILLGTAGSLLEEDFVDYYRNLKNLKPVIAFIAGRFVDDLKSGISFGHISSMIEGDRGKTKYKIEEMKKVGIYVSEFIQDIPKIIKDLLNG